MLIGPKHWKWMTFFAVTAVASVVVYVLYGITATPEGAFGGTTIGLWFGILAGLGMLAAAFLAYRKKYIISPMIPGNARFWLHVHLWVGTLALLWTFLHSGWRFGGPFEQILMGFWLFVAATGFYGLVLQHFIPRLMTDSVRAETFAQQIPILCRRLLVEADWIVATTTGRLPMDRDVPEEDVVAVFDALKEYYKEFPEEDEFGPRKIKSAGDFEAFVYGADNAPEPEPEPEPEPAAVDLTGSDSGSVTFNLEAQATANRERRSTPAGEFDPMADRLRSFYLNVVRHYLRTDGPVRSALNARSTADVQFDSLKSPLPPNLERAAEEVERICNTRRQYVAQGRLLWWLHSWLYLHIPASMVLLVLFLLHVFLALRVVPPGAVWTWFG